MENQRIKKTYDRKNGRTQRLMSFRIDADVQEMLATVLNKGRTVNEAVRAYIKARNRDESHTDVDPATRQIEDYEP